MTMTNEELRKQALAAFEARRRREEADHAEQLKASVAALQERAGKDLYDALAIESEPSEWAVVGIDEFYSGGRATAVVTKHDLRFAYHDRRAAQGPPVELMIQDRCPRCDAWHDAEELSLRASSYPPIERLGRYYARLESGDVEHRGCPAESRCTDESCWRADPHYGHAQTDEAAENAEPYGEPAPPAEDEPLAHTWAPDLDEVQELGCARRVDGQPCGKHADAHRQATPDEKLGDALREWLEANVGARAAAAGRAIHDEIERVVREGGDG